MRKYQPYLYAKSPANVPQAERWRRIWRIVALAAGNSTTLSKADSPEGRTRPSVRAGFKFDSSLDVFLRRNFSHGNSQSELASPRMIKKSLQPMRAMSIPPTKVPNAGPEAWSAEISELARPRWSSEKWREMILL